MFKHMATDLIQSQRWCGRDWYVCSKLSGCLLMRSALCSETFAEWQVSQHVWYCCVLACHPRADNSSALMSTSHRYGPNMSCRYQTFAMFWMLYAFFWVIMIWYIFNRSWVDTRWQQYITHLHTNSTQNTEKGTIGKCGPCPVFSNYTLAFALQMRKKHGKTSVRVAQTSVRVSVV
jgi:hypothetical protein